MELTNHVTDDGHLWIKVKLRSGQAYPESIVGGVLKLACHELAELLRVIFFCFRKEAEVLFVQSLILPSIIPIKIFST